MFEDYRPLLAPDVIEAARSRCRDWDRSRARSVLAVVKREIGTRTTNLVELVGLRWGDLPSLVLLQKVSSRVIDALRVGRGVEVAIDDSRQTITLDVVAGSIALDLGMLVARLVILERPSSSIVLDRGKSYFSYNAPIVSGKDILPSEFLHWSYYKLFRVISGCTDSEAWVAYMRYILSGPMRRASRKS